MQNETIEISKLKLDPENARTHDRKNLEVIKRSLLEFGQRRNIVVDKDNVVLAGNGLLMVAKEIGLKTLTVNRFEGTAEQAKAYALVDNRAGELSKWDDDRLKLTLSELKTSFNMVDFGFDLGDFGLDPGDENPEDLYTKKIKSPIYEITGERPDLDELCSLDVPLALAREIDAANISDDDKKFLKLAAWRHTVFDYAKIAEYYAHASPELKTLMENSALVIVDFNKAIERGFVALTEEIAEAYSDT